MKTSFMTLTFLFSFLLFIPNTNAQIEHAFSPEVIESLKAEKTVLEN